MHQAASVLSPQQLVVVEPIGRLLIQAGKLKRVDLESVVQLQARRSLRFGEAAVALGLVTRHDVEAALARQFSYPILHGSDNCIKPPLLTAYQPHSAFSEMFRNLRSELLLRWFDRSTEHKALAIIGVDTSGIIAQVAANLAVVFAQARKRVLLVDADLRQSNLGALLHCETRLGFSGLLAGREGVPLHVVEPFDYL
jgi:receptor protein-tyrosine kinase